MTKIGVVTTSISRNAGGIFTAVSALSLKLGAYKDQRVNVYSIDDENSIHDKKHWEPLDLYLFKHSYLKSFSYSPRLLQAIAGDRLDIVHIHGLWTYPSLAVHQWAKICHQPYIVSPHGMLDPWAISNSGYKKMIISWLYHSRFLKNAACLHALCDSEARAIRNLGFRNPICIIPNGVHHTSNNYPNPYVSLPVNAKVLLYLGRLHPKKGLINLLKAWQVSTMSPPEYNWHLVIVGWDKNDYQNKLISFIKSNGIGHSVHLLGSRFNDEKNACYQHADGFILPSVSEGLPLTILEAWTFGVPVLMTPECNIPEGFSSNAAIKIETGVDSLVKGLLTLFALSDNELQTFGNNGNKLVKDKFTWQSIADEMMAVYKWTIGAGKQPSSVHLD